MGCGGKWKCGKKQKCGVRVNWQENRVAGVWSGETRTGAT
jgi:hypothetical protein